MQSSALTGGCHLAYVVAAVCVSFGVLATWLILRPPAGPVQQEVDELERDFERAGASAQIAEQLA